VRFRWSLGALLHASRRSLPLGLLFVLNIAVGWWGLAIVNVPMFLAIRRTTTVMTMAVEFAMLGTVPSSQTRLAVCVIMLGTIVAGWESFNSDYKGYLFTLMNNAITAIQLNFAKHFRDRHKVEGFGLVFYNSLTALPLSLFLAWVSGEFEQAAAFPQISDPTFLATVLLASCLGAFMTYIVLLCATVNSPTATSVTGNIKDIVSTFVGAFLFPGFVPTVASVSGLAMSFLGGGWFTFIKLQEAQSKNAATLKAVADRRNSSGGEDAAAENGYKR
jgi:solute carrier family 35